MSLKTKTLLALDVDGVLNVLKYPQRGCVSRQVGPWVVSWRSSTLKELKNFLSRDDVTGVWLSRWIAFPDHLKELSSLWGLDELISLRAEHPATAPAEFGLKPVRDKRFPKVSTFEARSGYWWKFRSAELLQRQFSDYRFAWFDDELGYSNHAKKWAPIVSDQKFIKRVNPYVGLIPRDIRAVEAWHEGGAK